MQNHQWTRLAHKGARILGLLLLSGIAVGLISCGGGGSGSDTNTPPPPDPVADATIQENVRVLSGSDLGRVRSDTPGSQIVLNAALPSLKVGDVVVTATSALLITEIAPPASDGSVTLSGRTPELDEVFKKLKINVDNYALSPSQFTPAEGVTVARTGRSATLGKKSAQDVVAGSLTLNIVTKIAPTVEASTALTIAPSIDYNVDHEAVSGKIAFRSPISVTPKVTISGKVASFEKKFPAGSYTVPIVSPLTPPGFLALKVPIYVVIKGEAGEASLVVGAGATADYGVTLLIAPSGLDFVSAGDGFSFTSDGTNFSSFDIAVGASLDARLQTGVSLSAFFGLAEPLAALMSAGLKGELLYAKLAESTSTGAAFDVNCIKGTISGVAGAVASAKFFGFSATKISADVAAPVLTYSPKAGCTTFPIIATPGSTVSGGTVELSAAIPNAGLFQSPPTGSVAFTLASGESLCTQTLDNSGVAKCKAKITGTAGTDVRFDALYSGDSLFASGLASGAVAIVAGNEGFWQGSFKLTECLAPKFAGTGNACNYASLPPNGNAYSDTGQMYVRLGTTEPGNIRWNYAVGGNTQTDLCSAEGSGVDITKTDTFHRPYNLSGVFYSEPSIPADIVFKVVSRSDTEISGTFSVAFTYPAQGATIYDPYIPSGGLAKGTWVIRPRATSFPKCTYEPPAHYCVANGTAYAETIGITGACQWVHPASMGREGEWAVLPKP